MSRGNADVNYHHINRYAWSDLRQLTDLTPITGPAPSMEMLASTDIKIETKVPSLMETSLSCRPVTIVINFNIES